MEPAFIQAELKVRGITQAQLARHFSVSPQFIGKLVKGQTSSHRVARYVSKKLGKSVHELWPNRYHNRPRASR